MYKITLDFKKTRNDCFSFHILKHASKNENSTFINRFLVIDTENKFGKILKLNMFSAACNHSCKGFDKDCIILSCLKDVLSFQQ